MPQIYTTSIVKRSLYEEIKGQIQRMFLSFDHSGHVFGCGAIFGTLNEYLGVDEPLFWVGTSNKSMGQSDRIYRDAEQFKGDPTGNAACVPRGNLG